MFSADILIPTHLFSCPGCGGQLAAEVDEWETESRKPTLGGVTVFCVAEDDEFERDALGSEDHEPINTENYYAAVEWVRTNHRVPVEQIA